MSRARSAGGLRDRLHVQRPTSGTSWGRLRPDAGAFETVTTVWAALVPRTGSEAVTAARLEGRQPYVVTLRYSSQSKAILPSWRFVDARRPERVFEIASPLADPDGRRQWLECLAIEAVR